MELTLLGIFGREREEYKAVSEIVWNDRFNVGVECIDKAHQRLFSIVGKLLSLNQDTEKQQYACREGVKYFKSYTMKHFAEEEAYMKSIGYKDLDAHKCLHDNMRDITIPALEAELEEQNYSTGAIQHFLGMCVGWLNGHIMIDDHAIAGDTYKKWEHQPSESEIDSLEKAAIQALDNLYRIKAKPVSVHYGGEDFASGNALCFRLLYSSPAGEHQQIYLLYEEKLILSMIGDLFGKQIDRIDKTVSYAVKMLSSKYMDCIARHFPHTEGTKLEKTDLMTFEQFHKAYDRQSPPYSLLFGTGGKGYFALCVQP